MDVIFGLFNKYGQLIRGVSTHNDVVMSIWPVVFRTQWISDEQRQEVAAKIERGDFDP